MGSAFASIASNDNESTRASTASGAPTVARLKPGAPASRLQAREASFFEFLRDLAATHPEPSPFLCIVFDATDAVLTTAAHGEWRDDETARCVEAVSGELRRAPSPEPWAPARLCAGPPRVTLRHAGEWSTAFLRLPASIGRASQLAVAQRRSQEDAHDLARLALHLAHASVQAWTSCERAWARRSQAILRRMRNKLQEFEKVSALAQLCAGIAHEIRNPLTTARGFLQLFAERCDDKDRAYLELTIGELDRIRELLEDFMGLCRPEREERVEIDVAEIAQSVHRFLLPEASLCDIRLDLHLPAQPLMAAVRPQQIKQVLINLVQNALHACRGRPNAAVSLHLEEREGHVVAKVMDNGCGIQHVERIFRPFYTTKSTGTGLGLFVCKHIVEAHGGSIAIRSRVDEGTTVTVDLPKRAARRA
ncbi:sensor histidine kinase [Alicyclobacillus vulcanalis]|uniref:histidine kinase n=1 Tax=Alicyclobacillus vulcanalis TaxID=252246 RepID=A0A1N7N3D6_9BACL|nr:ATP-binding protein [Alicyclobacillus vulcanalis]SIS92840.1 Signal transduction histidine kinase [Alicyclobacillus vulcanalis]